MWIEQCSLIPIEMLWSGTEQSEWQQFLADKLACLRELVSRLKAVPYYPILTAHLARHLLHALQAKVAILVSAYLAAEKHLVDHLALS